MKNLIKGAALVAIAGSMMGNQSCEQAPEAKRELRRRVQMGQVVAPPIQLPQGGKFDFQYVANAQMYDILRKTGSFSTATIDPAKTYDTSGLSSDEAEVFNRCSDDEDDVSVDQFGIHTKTTISKKAACMIDMPQGIVSGNILDFTLTSGGGVSLKLSQIAFLSGLSFNFKKYELSLTMKVMDPLIAGGHVAGDRKTIATTSQQSFGKEWGAEVGLVFSGFELGPSYYYKTPLRKVVDEGLTSAINDLKTQWNEAQPWYAMVLRNCDKYIYVNAGNKTDAGLMTGDILKIQNVSYRWEGKSCESRLMGAVDYVGGPVAYAKVVTVGDTISTAVIIEKDPNYPYSPDQIIQPGARVYMEKMFDPNPPKKQ